MEEVEFQIPDKLYHYTAINSLSMILHHKTLRFTKLSFLNDPLEGKTADLQGAENLVYCSSWTSNEEDTIPMWKMYTDFKGVRISSSSLNMFKNTKEINNGNFGSGKINYSDLTVNYHARAKGFIGQEIIVNKFDKILGQIRYGIN